ncbi:hypothetical protein GQ53DRAFT_748853 [Thozetella sp. PMI_491]|nr:hypothetical protein GQ53DRAFT_748853 [Thozetella sp. PMI_491]
MKERAVRPTVQMVHMFEDDDSQEPLADLTESLTVKSKRTERQKKKLQKKAKPNSNRDVGLLDLPYELLLSIISHLRPTDLIRLLHVNRALHQFIRGDEPHIAQQIIEYRYGCLEKCFRLPAPIKNVDPAHHQALRHNLPQKYYHHIQRPDHELVCACMTCLNRWNCLCLAVDFHYWQHNLDVGQPIPIIPRGGSPEWNVQLIARNAWLVYKAINSPLTYATILEWHLDSITRSIQRHAQNKFNRRSRFSMTQADVDGGRDAFLNGLGPPTIDFPYHRDSYYLLEAYIPNRSWIKERNEWVYMPAEQHEKDVEIAVMWAAWRKKREQSLADGREEPSRRPATSRPTIHSSE